LTAQTFSLAGPFVVVASWAFIVGAIAMPICCGVMAHFPKAHLIFAVPVISLILGGALTLTLVVHEPKSAGAVNTATSALNPQPSTLNQP
jgi:hypothetical membrane protein